MHTTATEYTHLKYTSNNTKLSYTKYTENQKALLKPGLSISCVSTDRKENKYRLTNDGNLSNIISDSLSKAQFKISPLPHGPVQTGGVMAVRHT